MHNNRHSLFSHRPPLLISDPTFSDEAVISLVRQANGLTVDEVAAQWPTTERDTVEETLRRLYRLRKLAMGWRDIQPGHSITVYKYRY